MRLLKKLKIELPYDPAIPVLDIYLEKNLVRKNTCTPMFIAEQFTIDKTWKQPKCPLTDGVVLSDLHILTHLNLTKIFKEDIIIITPIS